MTEPATRRDDGQTDIDERPKQQDVIPLWPVFRLHWSFPTPYLVSKIPLFSHIGVSGSTDAANGVVFGIFEPINGQKLRDKVDKAILCLSNMADFCPTLSGPNC